MADDDQKKPVSEFDRMSLESLKRELASQKASTEQARVDAKERLAAESEKAKAFPWKMLAAVVLGGSLFFVLVAFAVQASFPEVGDYMIPDFVYHPWDGGPPRVHPDASRHHADAGPPDTGHATHHGHHATHGTTPGGDLGLDTAGGTDDPLEGL